MHKFTYVEEVTDEPDCEITVNSVFGGSAYVCIHFDGVDGPYLVVENVTDERKESD
jgi:hypothetical protein